MLKWTVALSCILGSTAAASTSVNLDVTQLPSSTGWTYQSLAPITLPPESQVFSVVTGAIAQNSIGFGETGPGYTYPRTSIDLSQPVTLLARALVTQSEPVTADNGAYALSFGIETLSNSVGFGLANDGGTFRIQDNSGQILSTAIDTSQFHDYRMVADFTAGTYTLFVDNVQIGTGIVAAGGGLDAIYFGDGTRSSNAKGEIAAFEVSSSPEPSSVALLGMGGILLLARRRGVARRYRLTESAL